MPYRQAFGQVEKLLILSLALATLSAYWRVRSCQFVNYDDHIYVSHNPQVKEGLSRAGVRWALTTTHSSNWHPLTWLSLQLDAQLYLQDLPDKDAGKIPAAGFHITNLLLHTANVLLLFWVLRRMTGTPWPSAVVAALFALHPLHVESVAWISERKDVLSTFFWMLTLSAYVRYVEKPGRLRFSSVFLALAAGLLAKSMLVTLPCVLLLLDYWPMRRVAPLPRAPEPPSDAARPVRTWRSLVLEKMPLFLLVTAFSGITYYVQAKGHAVRTLDDLSFPGRLANALISYADYLMQMVWPSNLAAFYPHTDLSWNPWRVVRAAVLLAVISIVVLRERRRRPYLIVGWLWYLGTLVPVIGLVQVGDQARADRYTYVPLIGPFIMAAWAGAELAAHGLWRARVVAVATVAALIACGMCTWFQVPYWHDSVALWQHTIASTGPNAQAHYSLAVEYREQGALGRATAELKETLSIRPGDERAHFQLGNILSRREQWADAVEQYNEALALQPDDVPAHMNLAIVLIKMGNKTDAMVHLEHATRLEPALKRTEQYQRVLASWRLIP